MGGETGQNEVLKVACRYLPFAHATKGGLGYSILLYSKGFPSLMRSTLPPEAQRMASAAAVSHSLVLL